MARTAEDWARLGRVVRRERKLQGFRDTARWAAVVGRSSRSLLGLERGEAVGDETLELVSEALNKGAQWAALILENRMTDGDTRANPEPQGEVNGSSVGGNRKGQEPYLSRREGPNLSDVSTDALLEEIAKRARANNPDALR